MQASTKLAEAAQILQRQPASIQLRYLQTLAEIGAEQNTVVVFPLPLDLIQPFMEITAKASASNGKNGAALKALKDKVVPAPSARTQRAKAD